MKLLASTPWEQALRPGVTIWRPVSFSSICDDRDSSCRIIHSSSIFKESPEGGFMARMAIPGVFIGEPELIPAQTKTGRPRPGIVVFTKSEIPENWTHMRIMDITYKLKKQGCEAPGGAIHAEFCEPFTDAEYCKFRAKWLREAIRHDSIEATLEAMEDEWPSEDVREDMTRLIIVKAPQGSEHMYDFVLLKDEAEAE